MQSLVSVTIMGYLHNKKTVYAISIIMELIAKKVFSKKSFLNKPFKLFT